MALEVIHFLSRLRRVESATSPEATRVTCGQGLLPKYPLSKDSLPTANPDSKESTSLEDLMGRYDRRYVRQNTID